VKGVIFGVVVWAGSYLGLLPLIGISESAHKEPVRMNLMMIAAHLVWGSAMALVADLLMSP
jgi:putative membrane protein